mmetsp:Transcript_30384/g.69944  ORF Transcript_30384/g.69944 Transcript_30384/m.69944 type:complete len:241 (-) Transcript_30384:188-910(-)
MPRASGALSSAPGLAFEATAVSRLADTCSKASHAFKAADFAADTASGFCDGSLPPAFANALPTEAVSLAFSSSSLSLGCAVDSCLSAFNMPATPPARTRLPCLRLLGFDVFDVLVSLVALGVSSFLGGAGSADGFAGDCQAKAIMAGASFAPGAAVRTFFLAEPTAPFTSLPTAASGSERFTAFVPLAAGKASMDCCTQATCCNVGATSTTSSSLKMPATTSSCGTKKPPMISCGTSPPP